MTRWKWIWTVIEEKVALVKRNLFLWRSHRQWSIPVQPHEILVVGWTFRVYGAVSLRISQSSKCSRHEGNLLLLDLKSRGSCVYGWNQVVCIYYNICKNRLYFDSYYYITTTSYLVSYSSIIKLSYHPAAKSCQHSSVWLTWY